MIFFKKCPCCKSSIFVWNDTACKCVENYKCYYCPKCEKQITLATKVKKENYASAIAITAIAIFLLSRVDDKDKFLFIGIIVLGILFLSLIYGIILGLLRHIDCFNNNCDDKIKRDNSDLWGSNMLFKQMDSIEKENMHQLINFSVGLGGYGIIIFIVIGVIISLVKYIFG